jgi:hypothetical protein
MKQILAWILGLFGGGKRKPPPVIVVPPPVEPEKPPPVIVVPPNPLPDRRPIGMIMIAEWIEPFIPGDYRWKLLGQYQFSREALLAHGEECVKYMKYVNAQAMILWNKEGEEYWKPVSYIGDPRIENPDIDPFINEFFELFKDFKKGVCLRPDIYYDAVHYSTADPVADLKAKATYAKDKWGCTIFYVDSNKFVQPYIDNTLGHGGPLPASVFIELNKEMPGCTFIPEHSTPEYYPHVPIWTSGTNSPDGAVVVGAVNGGHDIASFVAKGNIPLFEAWWNETVVLNKIKDAYDNLTRKV